MEKRSSLWVVAAVVPAWLAFRQRDRHESGTPRDATRNAEQRELEILLYKYELVQTGFLAVMSEFWQTNAFFTAFAGLAVGGIVTSWDDYAQAHVAATIPLTAVIVVLMLVWLLSIVRHNQHSYRLARHAFTLQTHIRQLEALDNGSPDALELFADVWSRRPYRRPALRRVWTFVPAMFVVTLVSLQVVAAF